MLRGDIEVNRVLAYDHVVADEAGFLPEEVKKGVFDAFL